MKRLVQIALLISLLFHAGLFFAFLQTPPQIASAPKPAWVELEAKPPSQTKFVEPPQGGGSSGTPGSRAQAKSSTAKLNFASSAAGNLLARWQSKNEQAPTPHVAGEDPMLSLEDAGQGYSRATQYSNAMDVTFTNDTLGFFQLLHRKVDGALIFPDDLVKAHFKGKVRIEAEVSNDGRLLEFVSTKADNDVLHAYALSLLVQVLKTPLPERVWLKTQQAVVVFDFDFELRQPGQDATGFITGAQKNRLAFGRDGVVDPILNEKINEIFTHYVPPIVPLPGGFYVDLIMAYQYIHNVTTNAPLESEVRMARAKSLHKELLQMIHSSRQPAGPTATPNPSDS